MIDIQNLTDHSWFVSLPSLIRRVLVLPFYIVLLVNKAVMFSYAVFRYSSFLIFPAIYVWLCWENVVKKYNILNGPASYKMLYLIVFIVHIVIVFYFTYLFNERINETATNYKDVYGTIYLALSSSLWVSCNIPYSKMSLEEKSELKIVREKLFERSNDMDPLNNSYNELRREVEKYIYRHK